MKFREAKRTWRQTKKFFGRKEGHWFEVIKHLDGWYVMCLGPEKVYNSLWFRPMFPSSDEAIEFAQAWEPWKADAA